MSESDVALEGAAEGGADVRQIVGPDGQPARRQEAGQPCMACGAAGSYVKPVMGGGCVCMKCGYQE